MTCGISGAQRLYRGRTGQRHDTVVVGARTADTAADAKTGAGYVFVPAGGFVDPAGDSAQRRRGAGQAWGIRSPCPVTASSQVRPAAESCPRHPDMPASSSAQVLHGARLEAGPAESGDVGSIWHVGRSHGRRTGAGRRPDWPQGLCLRYGRGFLGAEGCTSRHSGSVIRDLARHLRG